MKFDLKELKKLITLVEDADISELSLEDKDGEKVSIKKGGGLSVPSSQFSVVSSPPPPGSPLNIAEPEVTEGPSSEATVGLVAVKSPMVGSFYTAPNPDSPDYVKVGDHVNAGDTVCIVEAMKLFNEIETEISGTVVKINVENMSPVEYGQDLMLIKPD